MVKWRIVLATKEQFTDSEFESLLNEYDYNFKKGDLVKGIVWSYDSEGVIVDIGSKTSAIVPIREAKLDSAEPIEKALEKGKEYEFLIIKEEDEDGRFVLSRKKVDLAYNYYSALLDLELSDPTLDRFFEDLSDMNSDEFEEDEDSDEFY